MGQILDRCVVAAAALLVVCIPLSDAAHSQQSNNVRQEIASWGATPLVSSANEELLHRFAVEWCESADGHVPMPYSCSQFAEETRAGIHGALVQKIKGQEYSDILRKLLSNKEIDEELNIYWSASSTQKIVESLISNDVVANRDEVVKLWSILFALNADHTTSGGASIGNGPGDLVRIQDCFNFFPWWC